MALSISERGFGENSYTTKHSGDQVSLKSPALRRGFVCQGVTVDHFLRAMLGLWDPRVWGGVWGAWKALASPPLGKFYF